MVDVDSWNDDDDMADEYVDWSSLFLFELATGLITSADFEWALSYIVA